MKSRIGIIFILLLAQIGVSSQSLTLEYFIQKAKKNNPLLYDLRNRKLTTELDSLKDLAGYGWMASASSNFMMAPTYKGFGLDPTLSNGQTAEAMVTVSRQLISHKDLQLKMNRYRLNKKSLDNQSKISTKMLERTVTEQYINAYLNQELLHLSNEIIIFLEKEDQALKTLASSSIIKQTDYLNFKVILQQNKLANEQQHAQWLGNISTLNYLCGIHQTADDSIANPMITLSQLQPYNESIYGESFRIDSLKNKNNEQLINLNYKPHVSFFTNTGYSSSFMSRDAYKNFGFMMGVNITLSLYDGKQQKIGLQQNELDNQTRLQYRDSEKSRYDQQTQDLLKQIAQCDKMIAMAPQQFTYTKTLIDANARLLSSAGTTMTDFLSSITNYMNVRAIDIQNRTNKMLLINQLNYLILP